MLSAELVRSVLDSAPDAMVIIDAAGTIVFANHQVVALFGHPVARVVGWDIERLMPERFRGRHLGHRRRYAETGHARPMGAGLDLYALRADGTEFPVEISLSPIHDGRQVLVAAAIRDVSDRVAAERALKEARAEAERANLAKSRFLATASHDLRQPLQTMALLNGTLQAFLPEGEGAETLAQQEQAIGAMSRLLNALLDISKLESGAIKPDISDFGVATLLEELRAEFASVARSKGLRLTVEPCIDTVRSDPSLLGQILRNLLANALKYTESGYVLLACHREADAVRIDVRDSGIGISPRDLAHIYEEFYQVGVRANSSRDGYGLGLAIVRRLVQLLDLKIHVESAPGAGSTFSLVLPAGAAVQAPAPSQEARKRAAPPMAPHHLLVVEDDPGVRNATRLFLRTEGFRVTAAGSKAEAVKCARSGEAVDLVISDYHLGEDTTGMQVIGELREILGAAVPAILVTGDTSSAVRGLEQKGALRVTSKPINPDELRLLIRSLLESPTKETPS